MTVDGVPKAFQTGPGNRVVLYERLEGWRITCHHQLESTVVPACCFSQEESYQLIRSFSLNVRFISIVFLFEHLLSALRVGRESAQDVSTLYPKTTHMGTSIVVRVVTLRPFRQAVFADHLLAAVHRYGLVHLGEWLQTEAYDLSVGDCLAEIGRRRRHIGWLIFRGRPSCCGVGLERLDVRRRGSDIPLSRSASVVRAPRSQAVNLFTHLRRQWQGPLAHS